MKKNLLIVPVAVLLVSVALTQPVLACGTHFFKATVGPRCVPIFTFQTWEFQLWIPLAEPMPGPATTIEDIVVKDKIPAELVVGDMWFTDGQGEWPYNPIPPVGTVTVENMGLATGCGHGKTRSATEITWTIDQLGLGTYVLHFYVHTQGNPAGKKAGFTEPGDYLINYGAIMTYYYMGTKYTIGPTQEEWITVFGEDD